MQRIDFSGNVNVSDKKIKRFMQTKAGGLLPWLTSSGTFKKEQLDSDLQAIRYVFWEEGYINAVIQAPEVFLSPDKRFIFISFRVDEGERYDIGDVSVSGDFNADEGLTEEAVLALTKGRPAFSIQEEQWRTFVGKSGAGPSPKKGAAKLVSGEPFKASQMELVRMSIESLYQEQGYAFANVEMVPTPREGENVADIRIRIDRGEKYRVGKINIAGNDPTFDKVVRREIQLNEGDVFRGGRLQASKARIQRLGYF